jgi:hypothetical protein
MRLSNHSLEALERRAVAYVKDGWRVERPVYVDWWWRGYSIKLSPPMPCAFGMSPDEFVEWATKGTWPKQYIHHRAMAAYEASQFPPGAMSKEDVLAFWTRHPEFAPGGRFWRPRSSKTTAA